MTKLTDDRGEGARARTDAPGGLWPDWSGERSPMAGVVTAAYATEAAGAASSKVDDIYGWCGRCHCFTQFPHECLGEDRPAEDEAA